MNTVINWHKKKAANSILPQGWNYLPHRATTLFTIYFKNDFFHRIHG